MVWGPQLRELWSKWKWNEMVFIQSFYKISKLLATEFFSSDLFDNIEYIRYMAVGPTLSY